MPAAFADEAMRTRFEIILADEQRPSFLRAAAEAALAEIHRVESWLSPYRPGTAIATLNQAPVGTAVRLDPLIFGLLCQATTLTAKLDGAFDLLVGSVTAAQRGLTSEDIDLAPKPGLLLDAANQTATRLSEDSRLDPGGLGKGWALERALTVLCDAGLTNAFLHGGTSSARAMGPGPQGHGWRVALPGSAAPILLVNRALSVSSSSHRFASGSHIVDPRTGRPVQHSATVAVIHEDGTVAEAISTALVVLGPAGDSLVRLAFPSARLFRPQPSVSAVGREPSSEAW